DRRRRSFPRHHAGSGLDRAAGRPLRRHQRVGELLPGGAGGAGLWRPRDRLPRRRPARAGHRGGRPAGAAFFRGGARRGGDRALAIAGRRRDGPLGPGARRGAVPPRAGPRPLRIPLSTRPRRAGGEMIRFASSLLLLSIAFPALAAMDGNMHAGELAHQLDRLSRTGRVLYVAAHPDDENTRLLAYLANAEHLEVAYLSLTRGGGGQNLIGAEKGVLLDVIRTEELLAARRIDGARQFFTNARDYGYSKRLEEALEIWGLEQVLSDVVWVIRTFQPDVIITRFDETPPNHGHHMASARLARLAFDAAADPRRFPEHFEAGARPWKAERLLHNLAPWRTEKLPEDAISVDVGGYDPRLGRSYGEIAAVSRSQHKSQR